MPGRRLDPPLPPARRRAAGVRRRGRGRRSGERAAGAGRRHRPRPGSAPRDAGGAISRAARDRARRRGDRRRAPARRRPAPLGHRPRAAATSPGRSSLPARPGRSATSWSPSTRAAASGSAPATCSGARPASATIFDPNPVVTQGSYAGLSDAQGQGLDRCSPRCACRSRSADHQRQGLPGRHLRRRPARQQGQDGLPAEPRLHRRRPAPNNRFEALMAYFHIDRTRAYVDSLGLSQALRASRRRCARTRSPTTTPSTPR